MGIERAARASSRISRSRRRTVFFLLAAGWGFVCGFAAVVITLSVLERPVEFEPPLARGMGLAALIAIGGALLMAAAYREISKRSK
jgi:hypothetical protein